MINKDIISSLILEQEKFHRSHAARKKDSFLGSGMLYYALAYMYEAKTCMCLGSGSGFVPRLMRQAQRDLGIADTSSTILVDANLPEAGWGSPDYFSGENLFTTVFDIKLYEMTTRKAFKAFFDSGLESVDYLHIDADHSYEEARHDLWEFSELLSPRGVITMHDTRVRAHGAGVWKVLKELKGCSYFECVNLKFPPGVAILRRADG